MFGFFFFCNTLLIDFLEPISVCWLVILKTLIYFRFWCFLFFFLIIHEADTMLVGICYMIEIPEKNLKPYCNHFFFLENRKNTHSSNLLINLLSTNLLMQYRYKSQLIFKTTKKRTILFSHTRLTQAYYFFLLAKFFLYPVSHINISVQLKS